MATPDAKQLRRAYGFDEVAIVPVDVTINQDQTNIDLKIGDFTFAIPILTAARTWSELSVRPWAFVVPLPSGICTRLRW